MQKNVLKFNCNESETLITGPNSLTITTQEFSFPPFFSTISTGSLSNYKILLMTYKAFNNLSPLPLHSFSLPQVQLCKALKYSLDEVRNLG